MISSFKFLVALILSTLLGTSCLATVVDRAIVPAARSIEDMSARTANTCADPSLSRAVWQGFSGQRLAHILHYHWALVNGDSKQPAGQTLWSFQGPAFKAWPTQQDFTVPLFRLSTPSSDDNIVAIGQDAQTPPSVSGFNSIGLLGWVYDTPVCDSVPLLTAVLASQSDHYYTTDPEELANLISHGWTDGGIVAYVLPIPSL